MYTCAFFDRACDTAISVAPPPGNRRGSNTTLRTTCHNHYHNHKQTRKQRKNDIKEQTHHLFASGTTGKRSIAPERRMNFDTLPRTPSHRSTRGPENIFITLPGGIVLHCVVLNNPYKGTHWYILQMPLCCSTRRYDTHLHGIREVSLDLVEHVLAAAPEQHGARLRVLASLQERKVPEIV